MTFEMVSWIDMDMDPNGILEGFRGETFPQALKQQINHNHWGSSYLEGQDRMWTRLKHLTGFDLTL